MRDPMDNFMVHVCGYRPETLDDAMTLVMGDCSVSGWGIARTDDGSEWLALYWLAKAGVNAFPSKLKVDDVKPIVARWLAEHEPYSQQPDIDGSVSKGFELVTPRGCSYEQFRIRPIWAEHHK